MSFRRAIRGTVFALGLASILFGSAQPAFAAWDWTRSLVVKCDVAVYKDPPTNTVFDHYDNPCGVNSFLEQFLILMQFGYNVAALLGVGTIIIGGLYYLMAAGRQAMVQRGTSIISGTATGLIIVFTAYLIVNFTVSAVAGTKKRSFSPIGFIFPNEKEKQYFDEVPNVTAPDDCRSGGTWVDNCSDPQVGCADPLKVTNGPVTSLKARLNAFDCNCGAADACYGTSTVQCVRRFQIANGIEVTGAFDSRTRQILSSSSVKKCTGLTGDLDAVLGLLPQPTVPSGKSLTKSGCCVIGGQRSAFYCTYTTEQACFGLGSSATSPNLFDSGKYCGDSNATKDLCGFCAPATKPGACLQFVGRNWCTGVQPQPQTFMPGQSCTAHGNACTSCTTSLFLKSPAK